MVTFFWRNLSCKLFEYLWCTNNEIIDNEFNLSFGHILKKQEKSMKENICGMKGEFENANQYLLKFCIFKFLFFKTSLTIAD